MSTDKIHQDPQHLVFIQSRAAINHTLVAEYAAMMRAGVEFEAAQGIQAEDGQVYVYDGQHRGEAARVAGMQLLVEVQPGSQEEAEWQALAANQKHGLRRTRADKQQVVRNALLHRYGANKSDREIARHCGVDHKTVAVVRQELELSGKILCIVERTVNRGGATYRQNTRNIGGRLTGNGQVSEGEQKASRSSLVNLHNQAKSLKNPSVVKDSVAPKPATGQMCLDQPGQLVDTVPDMPAASLPEIVSPASAGEQPTAQEFECPHCGQERVVGVNGSRRWCLNCDAEWPTAAAFLTAATVTHNASNADKNNREGLERRFSNLLVGLAGGQLAEVEGWLKELEYRLQH